MDIEDIKKKLQSFSLYYQRHNTSGFDFEFDLNETADYLRIGRNKAGSEICIFKYFNTSEENSPIAWIDGEGTFKSVFAKNIQDFFQLFPYLDGLVYDLLFRLNDLKRKNNLEFDALQSLFSKEYVEDYLNENLEEHLFLKTLILFLKDKYLEDTPYRKPEEIIYEAYTEFSSFENWYNNNQK